MCKENKCNHNNLLVVTDGIQCNDCYHLITIDIKDIHYWTFFDDNKKRDIINQYPSLTFREFANYDLEERKDIDIINNQAFKITSLQAEIERLNKIIIGQAEILVKLDISLRKEDNKN